MEKPQVQPPLPWAPRGSLGMNARLQSSLRRAFHGRVTGALASQLRGPFTTSMVVNPNAGESPKCVQGLQTLASQKEQVSTAVLSSILPPHFTTPFLPQQQYVPSIQKLNITEMHTVESAGSQYFMPQRPPLRMFGCTLSWLFLYAHPDLYCDDM